MIYVPLSRLQACARLSFMWLGQLSAPRFSSSVLGFVVVDKFSLYDGLYAVRRLSLRIIVRTVSGGSRDHREAFSLELFVPPVR